MSTHPYLRAYMAGLALPTIVMLFIGALSTAALTSSPFDFPAKPNSSVVPSDARPAPHAQRGQQAQPGQEPRVRFDPRELRRRAVRIRIPIERLILFPLTFVPNLFGLWNMLYIKLQSPRWPIGFHGAVLPFIIAPLGFAFGHALGIVEATSTGLVYFGRYAAGSAYFDSVTIPYSAILAVAPLPIVVYYLVWKYIIAFFNRVLGLA